jgi:hypothetical protein
MRRRLSLSFSFVEDVIYVGLGLLLTGVAAALLIAEIIYFVQDLLAGRSYSPHHIFVEVLTGCRSPSASMCYDQDRFLNQRTEGTTGPCVWWSPRTLLETRVGKRHRKLRTEEPMRALDYFELTIS